MKLDVAGEKLGWAEEEGKRYMELMTRRVARWSRRDTTDGQKARSESNVAVALTSWLGEISAPPCRVISELANVTTALAGKKSEVSYSAISNSMVWCRSIEL